MKKLISVRRAFEDPAWLGGMLGGESFAVGRTLLIAAMGEAVTAEELVIFTQITNRTAAPSEPVEEFWGIAGRRSGKTSSCGLSSRLLRLPRDPWPWRARDPYGERRRRVLRFIRYTATSVIFQMLMRFSNR
jgi:hypothetical protein